MILLIERNAALRIAKEKGEARVRPAPAIGKDGNICEDSSRRRLPAPLRGNIVCARHTKSYLS